MNTVELRDVFCVHRTGEGDAAALQGLSLEVERGQLLCVLGPSGSGKTTLLELIAGLRVPSAGVVRVLGRDIGRLSARGRSELRNRAIGFVDQRPGSAMAPDLTVAQCVAMPLLLRGSARREYRARVDELLSAAGLADRAGDRPGSLSGGERQRLALCAAVAHRPAVLLADEPTGELDDGAAESVLDLIAELSRTHGTTAIVVSHDAATAERAERTIRIRDGRVVQDCSALVVGRGGWVQLPAELLGAAGIATRARVRRLDAELILTAAESVNGSAPPAPPAPPAPRAVKPAHVELRAVSRWRGGSAARRRVLDEFSLELAPGRLTAITGRSGSGKTTLIRLIAALDVADAGEVLFDRVANGTFDAERLAALRRSLIGYLSQEPSPVGFLSAHENLVLALTLRGSPPSAAAERADATLARLGLAERARQRVARLSAGEAQRVALARALACARGLLVVDEPTSRLDEANASAVGELLEAAAAEGQTVVCATHDPQVIAHAAEVVALEAGRG